MLDTVSIHQYLYTMSIYTLSSLKEPTMSKKIFVFSANPKVDSLSGGLADAYQQADLVTYPSLVEGFGNAFFQAQQFSG